MVKINCWVDVDVVVLLFIKVFKCWERGVYTLYITNFRRNISPLFFKGKGDPCHLWLRHNLADQTISRPFPRLVALGFGEGSVLSELLCNHNASGIWPYGLPPEELVEVGESPNRRTKYSDGPWESRPPRAIEYAVGKYR